MSEQNFLRGARVYLSGPMDFVGSREDEKKLGWRNRVGDFLRAQGAIVFDPWFKPGVRGAQHYGIEDVHSIDVREEWTFDQGQAGDEKRSECAEKFWETLHIDLRMVDTSDFTIAYVPTNIYSVGTVHEIVLSRLQWKPVLFVSPPVIFPALDLLRAHLEERKDLHALQLLARLTSDVPIKPNPRGVPSLWYMPLVGSGSFFDGFGFADYREKFGWDSIPLDAQESAGPPQNPLLPFLEKLTRNIPLRWDNRLKKYVPNDDWLLWDLDQPVRGETVRDAHAP
ncbi:MAG: hypothetical protein H0X40_04985 [Chthoniobacterales bacterium]|nr:hypothetical protein [Chthoniobacterales bacterium]